IDLGFFQEGDRIELIRGELVPMVSKGKAHTVCCMNLNEQLVILLSGKAKVRCQDPILLPNNSEPEPDFVIVRNRADNYLSRHPMPEDIIGVIEIADSSLQYDREVKLPLYAEANIAEYWLVNLLENQLEIYKASYQKSNAVFDYRQKQVLLPDETVALPEFSDAILELARVFPGAIA
ncbi:Uma2 family endonuclease, partial [Phormidium sp. CCY1219]|uniref:Uma2 family endonuclease n=1 Tax=Phormidium sp. CCY1219 TaxID=2886104 RepID=UPI002D1F88EE